MSFVLKGIPYPISKSPLGYLFSQEGIATLKSDLIQLLLTNPKERVMLPSYGTPLRKLLFSSNDAALVAETKRIIANSIESWEPRIVISQIDITNGRESSSENANELNSNDHVLSISISFFDPQKIDYVEVLTIQLPTGGEL